MYENYTDEQLQAEYDKWFGYNKYITNNVREEMNRRKKDVPKEGTTEELQPYVKSELFGMNKKEQIEIIEKLSSDGVPEDVRNEKERVNLILELQGE